jgi:hypothetical protein
MSTDIDESDCIVVETKEDDVAKRSVGLVGSPGPADAAASLPSSEAGNRAVDEGAGWTRVTRQRAKGNTRASTSEPAAKAVKVFTSTGELERKRKAEDGTTEQVAQLKELVYRLLKSQEDQETIRDTQQERLLAAIEAQAKTICWNINHLMLHESVASHFSPTQLQSLKQRFKGKPKSWERSGLNSGWKSQDACHITMPYTERRPQQVVLLLHWLGAQ